MSDRDALRDRLVKGAGDVFYRDGIAATGTAALSKELGISKRTMYELFATKDELVAATLAARDEPTRAAFLALAERAGEDPADQLVGLFAGLEDFVRADGYRGCPFLNATAEYADPDHPVRAVCAAHEEQTRRWLERTARRARLVRPALLAEQLMVLLDGALARAALRPPRPGSLSSAASALVRQHRG